MIILCLCYDRIHLLNLSSAVCRNQPTCQLPRARREFYYLNTCYITLFPRSRALVAHTSDSGGFSEGAFVLSVLGQIGGGQPVRGIYRCGGSTLRFFSFSTESQGLCLSLMIRSRIYAFIVHNSNIMRVVPKFESSVFVCLLGVAR